MSTAPSRTRSLRKPAAGTTQYEKSTASTSTEALTRERGNQSPSRLPKPPSSSLASTSLSRTTSISRSGTSSNSNGSTRPLSQRAGVSRPPLTSENKTTSHRSGARTPTESSSSLRQASSTRHTRNSSTSVLPSVSRPPSVIQTRSKTSNATNVVPATASTTIRPPSSSSTSHSTTTTNSAPENKHHRPAFSILQQHFSPLKIQAPKPATSTFLAPPSPSKHPLNIQAREETSRLQAELLQLHLLHRNSALVATQYRHSAKRGLQARFEEVVIGNEELLECEREELGRLNILGVKAWAEGAVPGWGLDERVQVLDQLLAGVWKMGEPGGRYMRVVRRFERWLGKVWDIFEERKQRGERDRDEGEVRFVEELDTEWKEELGLLGRKLDGWKMQLRDLEKLGGWEGKSSLAVVVNGVRELIKGMVEEVKAMERVDKEVMAREEEWIREVLEENSDDEIGKAPPGALWRVY